MNKLLVTVIALALVQIVILTTIFFYVYRLSSAQ